MKYVKFLLVLAGLCFISSPAALIWYQLDNVGNLAPVDELGLYGLGIFGILFLGGCTVLSAAIYVVYRLDHPIAHISADNSSVSVGGDLNYPITITSTAKPKKKLPKRR